MNEPMQFLLLGIAGIALVAICYRFRVIGVRGGGVDRDENPIAYSLAITVLALGSLAGLVVALFKVAEAPHSNSMIT